MQGQDTVNHSAPHDRSFFQMVNFYVAIGVLIFGLITGEYFVALLGLVVGIVYWFTTPRHYVVTSDSLVVIYGSPRVLVVPFSMIFDVNIVRVPLTSGIFVRRVNRPGVIIRPRDMEGFVGQLWTALSAAGAPAVQNMLAQSPMAPDEAAATDDFPSPEDAPHLTERGLPPEDDMRAPGNEPDAESPPPAR